jgi:hypothetical protein
MKEPVGHVLDGTRATEPAQLPNQVSLRGDLEHDLGAAHAAHHATRKRLVAEHVAACGDNDWMKLDVHPARADAFTQIRNLACSLAGLDAHRSCNSLADAAIDQSLESNLRIDHDVRSSHIYVEQRRHRLSVLGLDRRGNLFL